jgi:hypothetical protein
MPRFEIFLVESVADHAEAEAQGFAAHTDDVCSNCEEPVGLAAGELFDYVVVTDEADDFWFTCDACATPVTDPEA